MLIRRLVKRILAVSAAASLSLFLAFNFMSSKHGKPRNVGSNRPVNSSIDFQVIEKDLAFAYSAYIDDRPARDSGCTGCSVVRIFIYFDRKINAKAVWECRFWYKNSDQPMVTPVREITNLDTFSNYRRFMPAMAICILPENGDLKPTSVSLVPKSVQTASNEINIIDLQLRRDQFLKEASQKKRNRKASGHSDFTVCVRAISNDYYKAHDVVNFIEVNRLLGAEKFIFYADENTTNLSINRCLEVYSKLGIVEIYPFSPPVLESLLCHGQVITLNDCLYRSMWRTKFAINIDLDEFIVPRQVNNWTEMLINIHNTTANTDHIAAYNFRNQFFPLEEEDDPYYENNTIVNSHNITVLAKTLKEDFVFPLNIRSKVMARPEKILMWHTHLVLGENLIFPEDFVYFVRENDALLFHYRQWTSAKKRVLDRRMHEFASRLIEEIPKGLKRCLPSD